MYNIYTHRLCMRYQAIVVTCSTQCARDGKKYSRRRSSIAGRCRAKIQQNKTKINQNGREKKSREIPDVAKTGGGERERERIPSRERRSTRVEPRARSNYAYVSRARKKVLLHASYVNATPRAKRYYAYNAYVHKRSRRAVPSNSCCLRRGRGRGLEKTNRR